MKFFRVMRNRGGGFAIGGAITLVGIGGLLGGLFDRLDNYGLDLHFRHLSTIEADPRIVLIDINDHALQALGDWPWPRRRHAQLVSTLNELGAKTIVLDLVFSDPATPRIEHAGLDRHYDIDTGFKELGDRSFDPIIYDDDELGEAIAEAGNVYLAMFFRLTPPNVDPSAVINRATVLLESEPNTTRMRFGEIIGAEFPAVDAVFDLETLYWQTRIAIELEGDFALDTASLVTLLGGDDRVKLSTIETHLPSAKTLVARRAARRFFSEHPNGTWESFREATLPGTPKDVLTPDKEDLLLAFRAQDAIRALFAKAPATGVTLAGRVSHAHQLTVPLDKLAKVAAGIGFVSFEREKSGGVVRDTPLVADANGRLLLQLGLLVAVDTLGIDRTSIEYDGNDLVIGTGSIRRRLRLSEEGSTLLNWHVPAGARRWQDSFQHIPVARVMEIVLADEAIADNERILGLAMGELVELRHRDTPADYVEYVRLVNRRLGLGSRSGSGNRSAGQSAIETELVQLEALIGQIEKDAVRWVRRAHGLWQQSEPVDEQEREQRERIEGLYAKLGEGQLAARLGDLNDNLAARKNTLRAELKPRLDGKICLVGYTASGVADLVTSPVYGSMPGVMAHANIINEFLQDQAAYRVAGGVNALIVLLGGMAVIVVACCRGPLLGLTFLGVLAGAVVILGGLTFRTWSYHVATLPIVVQMGVVWASVTVYRQFTEERSRRRFQLALAQYTSPAVAARIADRAGVDALSPRPAKVTCFFSDLQAFTKLSERLGPERTRLVLNPYLRVMSRTLIDHGAIINKFMGDGIFAFFNAPIWPCPDHGEKACAGALASFAALDDLNRKTGDAPDHDDLVMRIGLSTGEVFVGDYGSDTKLDYTCIGDTVNVASRLETANKALGTSILVDQTTREEAGDRFAFRPLGRIAVTGRTLAVEVYELIGSCESVDQTTQTYLTHFEQAIRHYQSCKWDLSLTQLDRCRELRNHDPAAQHYRRAVEHCRSNPPKTGWDGAITLNVQ